jgi:hypothetical protein
MKILLSTVALVLCLAALGCEMHPSESNEHADGKEKAPSELQKALQPEPANPDPPSFFPTPKPK